MSNEIIPVLVTHILRNNLWDIGKSPFFKSVQKQLRKINIKIMGIGVARKRNKAFVHFPKHAKEIVFIWIKI